jgi:alanine-glyoxylate transaminase/serine-glyoxylate transaminase/serine-pyruvate transaminase
MLDCCRPVTPSNGHGAWEASLTNVLSKGDKILVLESGRFAVGWGEYARRLGVEVEILRGDMRRAVRPEEVEARLKSSSGGAIKAIIVTQIDTASGVVNDIAAIDQARRAASHDALLMVDAVASIGCMPFEMDAWGVDVAMAGSQKGLMTPPGLGFVAANDRACEVHKKANLGTPYWDWTERESDVHYLKYVGTPPEHLLFGLRQALEEGIENAFRRHRLLAETTRRTIAVWSQGQALDFNIIAPSERSDTVSVVLTRGCDPDALRAWCRENCGVVIGHGIGELSGKAFRVAHMGHVNAPTMLGILGVIEMALGALGIPHAQGGIKEAIMWLGQQVGQGVQGATNAGTRWGVGRSGPTAYLF